MRQKIQDKIGMTEIRKISGGVVYDRGKGCVDGNDPEIEPAASMGHDPSDLGFPRPVLLEHENPLARVIHGHASPYFRWSECLGLSRRAKGQCLKHRVPYHNGRGISIPRRMGRPALELDIVARLGKGRQDLLDVSGASDFQIQGHIGHVDGEILDVAVVEDVEDVGF